MKRRHFAVFTQLGNGHVYPVLPLCMELARRGHRVTYATNDHYAQMTNEAGAEPVLLKNRRMSQDIKEQMRIGLALPYADPRFKAMHKSWRSHFFSDTAELLPQIEKFYRKNTPDLILYDRYHIPGRILAKLISVPAVQISPHFAYFNNLAARINGVCENPDFVVEWSKELDSFLSTYGFTSEDNCWHIEKLNVHFIPREFQHNCNYFDDRFCFAGALLGRPFQRIWTNSSNHRPVILISGMSLWSDTTIDYSGYFGTFVDALSDLPYHCVLSIGDHDFPQKLPPNFELSRRASHLEILPHTALSICHGGMASTLEAIYNGVPALMVPMSQACEEVAYRAQELGLGIHLAKHALSVETIRVIVGSMLEDNALRKRVNDMRDVFKRSGGAELAADRIECCLVD
jgi:MGT family glycosyltransferase